MVGAKSVSLVRISAPTACPEDFRSPISAVTMCSRSTGSSSPTGSGAIIAVIRLPSAPCSSVGADADRDHRPQLDSLGLVAAGPQVAADAAGDERRG